MNTQNLNIQIFQSSDGKTQIDVRFENETLWLSQAQMAVLFDRDSDTIGLHLKAIYQSNELVERATTEDSSVVRKEGNRNVTRSIRFYNLDAIISVGYRINSVKGTQFRIWATNVLRQHLVQGYSLNQRRLQERGIEFEEALSLLSQTLINQNLVSEPGSEILRVVTE